MVVACGGWLPWKYTPDSRFPILMGVNTAGALLSSGLFPSKYNPFYSNYMLLRKVDVSVLTVCCRSGQTEVKATDEDAPRQNKATPHSHGRSVLDTQRQHRRRAFPLESGKPKHRKAFSPDHIGSTSSLCPFLFRDKVIGSISAYCSIDTGRGHLMTGMELGLHSTLQLLSRPNRR